MQIFQCSKIVIMFAMVKSGAEKLRKVHLIRLPCTVYPFCLRIAYYPKNPPLYRIKTIIITLMAVTQKLVSPFLGSPCLVRLIPTRIAIQIISMICGQFISVPRFLPFPPHNILIIDSCHICTTQLRWLIILTATKTLLKFSLAIVTQWQVLRFLRPRRLILIVLLLQIACTRI